MRLNLEVRKGLTRARPPRAYPRPWNAHHRRLSVEGNQCTFHWDSDPHPEDLRAALTDPVIGLAGAAAHPTRDGWPLHYKLARLTVHAATYTPQLA